MSYQVLARQWRPKNFQAMVGQSHVLRALINALDKQRLHHAYLFTGTRGVGKTTIARILAKCFNCEKGVSSTPCGECDACQAIDQGRFIDLIEVDAASRTKVEDTNELMENVQYAPTSGRFKVYLIDEVHMLSRHSFNALLKTLEEPPEHVKFLLATTHPQKLPATVLSRCLQFFLKNLSIEQIAGQLTEVLQQEKIEFEPQALLLLAEAAEGSMRDGLSLLDQAIAFTDSHVTTTAVLEMLGSIDKRQLLSLLSALVENNAPHIFVAIAQLAEQGADFANVLETLLSMLHRVAMAHILPDAIDDTMGDKADVVELCSKISAEDTQLFYQIGLHGRRDLPMAPSDKSGFEMTLLRMLAFRPAATISAATISAATISAATISVATIPAATNVSAPEMQTCDPQSADETPALPKDATAKPTSTTQSAESTAGTLTWSEIVSHLKLTGLTAALASQCTMTHCDDGTIHLQLEASQAPLLNDTQQKRLQTALSEHLAKPIKLMMTIGEQVEESPAVTEQRQQSERQQEAVASMQNNPQVKEIIAVFDGIIDVESVEPIKNVREIT